MILAQPELRKAVKEGSVAFDPPLEERQWGEASVDLRLGFKFTRLKKIKGFKISVAEGLSALAASGFWEEMTLQEQNAFGHRQTFPLGPGEFILAMTHETVKVPNHLIALIEGRSTYARVGLSMHQTAPWIQPGWSGPIILEMMNNGPLTIELCPLIDRPCQLTFFRLSSELPPEEAYGARPSDVYQNQDRPFVGAKTVK
jgi:dCTP deaminase